MALTSSAGRKSRQREVIQRFYDGNNLGIFRKNESRVSGAYIFTEGEWFRRDAARGKVPGL